MPDSTYENHRLAMSCITRNETNIEKIEANVFWLSDVTQSDGSKKIELSTSIAMKHWLKASQPIGQKCFLFPVDGNTGVFLKEGLPVKNPDRFSYLENETIKTVGDCDCLITNSIWRFIEFKTDASSHSDSQIQYNVMKASAQLGHSMCYFRENFEKANIQCICIIVLPAAYPKTIAANFKQLELFRKKFRVELQILRADNRDILSL